MVTIVGQDKITAKRDLKNIFPKEFANRLLINEFITYILNNFFEKSNEKLVNGYVGEVVPSVDGTECYISEPTAERSINQIIPILNNDEQKITYQNFIADLHNEGVKIFDENKLISSKFWSWCPPINVDMFINSYNYYWVGWDFKERDTIILTGKVDVSLLIGQSNPIYYEYDDEGRIIEDKTHKFKNGERIVFTNDTSDLYNFVPYEVSGLTDDDKGYFKLTAVKMPIIVLDGKTNVAIDIEGKENYTYVNEDHNLTIKFKNGMRFLFINDSNKEYNSDVYSASATTKTFRPFMVSGVGESIKLLDDSYDPYEYFKNDEKTYYKLVTKPDYFVMERDCLDGNEWSIKNRWVNVKSLEEFNVDSITSSNGEHGLYHASMPIMCYNKDIELYNYGTFNRGYIVAKTSVDISEINNKDFNIAKDILGVDKLNEGDNILFAKENDDNPIQLYTVTKGKGYADTDVVILKVCKNGQEIDGKLSDGSSIKGDVVKLSRNGTIVAYYFDGLNWIEGQKKDKYNQTDTLYNGFNQTPLFNLYDADKILLNNEAVYPSSTFKGSKLFDYKDATYKTGIYSGNTSQIMEKDDGESVEVIGTYGVDRFIEVGKEDSKNYIFDNHIHSDVYYYTPENDYEKEIEGYKFFKINGKDLYLNDWYLSRDNAKQYIKTKIEANIDENFVSIDGDSYYKFTLAYIPSESSVKASLIVYNNGNYVNNENIIKHGKDLYIKDIKRNDVLIINLLTDDDIEELDENYSYELPLSLTRNQYNEEIDSIGYNNCFDQMIDIMESQVGFEGVGNGYNNYYLIKHDLSVGTKIIQSSASIIRSMILDDEPDTSIRASIEYVENAYDKFKTKFMNMINQYYIKGLITEDNKNQYESEEESMDDVIKEIINKINVGKSGLQPFYNNGVTHLIENAYIPATPAYLGISNCYEPKIVVFNEFIGEEKPSVIIGHDGSLTKATGTVKDLFVKRLEDLIYGSINTKFKDTKCGIDKFEFMPGFFRTGTYTKNEVIDTYSTFIDVWANENGIDYSENLHFDYDLTANSEAWKTWNYTGCVTPDGDILQGSYRAVYMNYYDTYRPDTHPWEILGFGDKPSWWDENYGTAPYTSANMVMWQDIENGIIKDGNLKGEYKELKRPGLIEKYMPVDENGKLKSLLEIGIIDEIPMIQKARARWKIGDIGDAEFAFMQTSSYRYIEQLLIYLLRPIEWVETNWNTLTRETLFRGTDYEQIIDNVSKKRENIKDMVMHNEYIDGQYIRNIGIQQWISDYVSSNTLDITSIANKIRNSNVNLGYRLSGFFEKDTLRISTDTYGELPEENIHTSLFKSKMNNDLTYSAMLITKTKKGYTVDGFDKSFPYFRVRKPILTGKKSTYESDGLGVYYYLTWSDEVFNIPYRSEFTSIQEVYNVINGYGKYLEDNEGWYFNTRNSSGVILNWRTSGESFVQWATAQKGESTDGNIILLNPGVIGLGVYNNGMIDDLNLKSCGYDSVLDINGNPIEAKDMNVFRQSFNTYIQPKDNNISFIKLRKYLLEHLLVLDNETIYGDTIYSSKYYTVLGRFNLSCVKVKNWYGTIYAPGYLLTDEGGIPNFDKSANDFQYMFDVDDARCQAEYAEYSRGIVGYNRNKTYINLMKDDKAMFDFYKGAIREKGTREVLNKINRSSYVSSTGNNIDIYESWLIKAGEFGHTKNDSILEFLLDTDKMKSNPQIITFETTNNYYYDENKTYNIGNVVIYKDYEYTCLDNDTSGKFNPDHWKLNRFVGNYIIFNNDENWIKKQKNQSLNGFSYTKDLLFNPVGGFAQLNDVEYIVADETEFEETKDSMSVGESIWIVKLANGDWDIRKKTGVNKFVSMRYPTLKDAYEQKSDDSVYHFKDDKKDYYTNLNSIDIEDNILTPLYKDIDLNEYDCRWCDIGSPIYTGETGSHVIGTDYKVKMFNTVFKTMVKEDNINNSSILRDLDDNTSISYSNLLLNMTQFGRVMYKYKWIMKLHIDTRADNLIVNVNGTEYKDKKDINLIVCEGDVINWSASAFCCESKSGTIYIPYVSYDDPTDIDVLPETADENTQYLLTTDNSYYAYSSNYCDPSSTSSNKHWIKLGSTKYTRQLDVTVPLIYKAGEILLDQITPDTREISFAYPGTYNVKLVGAGGGAGGGWVVKKKRGHIKKSKYYYYGGCAGASGAYLDCNLLINDNDTSHAGNKYIITCGAGGVGGPYGDNGITGTDTTLVKNDTVLLVAQGGAGGAHALNDCNIVKNGRKLGYGGTYSFKDNDTVIITPVKTIIGNNGGIGSYEGLNGKSTYPGSTYGEGGTTVVGGNGNSGKNGYMKIEIISINYPIEDISYDELRPASIEESDSDSMEYSSYYQPFVVPYNDEIQYFYSYDVLYDDDLRPDASKVTSATRFFKNRSKTITGKHNGNVVKNLWQQYKLYKSGDLVTYGSRDNYVYYKCISEHTSGDNFELTRETVTLWEEYIPTYYYKINFNGEPVYDSETGVCSSAEPNYIALDKWEKDKEYKVNDKIKYDDKPYKCINEHTSSSTFDGSKWEEISDYKKYNTELYEDANCSIRATKDNFDPDHPENRYMFVTDLQEGYNTGREYTLVDLLATYNQLTPRYLTEPSWGVINQVGTYDIMSGNIQYYVNSDKETIEKDENALVYDSEICINPVVSINPEISGNSIVYTTENMKYTFLTNVTSDHLETTYELKDNDIYLYTNKTSYELTDDTPVYSEFELENEIGTYGEYVPHWEKITYTPNSFTNIINFIDYESITYRKSDDEESNDEESNDEIKNEIINYDLTLYKDRNYDLVEDEKLYIGEWQENSDEEDPVKTDLLFSPSKFINDDCLVYHYVEDDRTKIVLFKEDGTKYTNDLYAKKKSSTSTMFVEDGFKEDVINQTSVLYNSKQNINNSVKMYFNRQNIGEYINSNYILVDTDETDEIKILFNDIKEDPMYGCLENINREISTYTDINDKKAKIKEMYDSGEMYNYEYTKENFYINYNELISLYASVNYNTEHMLDNYASDHFRTHTCRVFDTYRNEDNVKVYYRLYMYGTKLYVAKHVALSESNIELCGISVGDISDVTTYNKILSNEITEDKIVNKIYYKSIGDNIYITNDSYYYKDKVSPYYYKDKVLPYSVCDLNGVSKVPGTYGYEYDDELKKKKGWMKLEYIEKDYMFNLLAAQRQRIATDNIKSCYLVDDYDDSTIVKVQVFDPIQNIIPNNVLGEVNYISSTDPVINYEDSGKWNDNKIGYLWWDTSKVRYVDYYQGDYDYRKENWGKQLPGSEIVINEWVRSPEPPEDGRNYVTRTLFDTDLASNVTYYYYWEKNPVEKPDVSFRTNSALTIASIINNPSEEGIVWMSPIDTLYDVTHENTLILCNYNNVITGQEAVLQINMDSDKDVLTYSEWVRVLENANNGVIPDFLWEKMRDSLIGYKVIDGKEELVPDPDLTGRRKLGIEFRPRQTMFNNIYNARENFIDVINSVFSSRTFDQLSIDTNSWLVVPNENHSVVDMPNENEYYDEADTKLEMMSWRDPGLIGQNILVRHDETHNGIWAIYKIEYGWKYSLVDYQKYNINDYMTLNDWYDNEEIKYITPTYVVTSTAADAMALCKTLEEGKIVKFIDEDGNWELYQSSLSEGIKEARLVAKSSTIVHISRDIYDYVNNSDLDKTEPYIVMPYGNKDMIEYSEVYESEEEPENPDDLMYWYDTTNEKLFRYYSSLNDWVEGYSITRYEYEFNQSQYLLEKLIEYFEV